MNEILNIEPAIDGRPGYTLPELDWKKQGGMVLMVGWMDPPALETTLDKGLASFFSRTRGVPWTKGEISGNVLRLTDMANDCEGGDTLVVLAEPVGPTCSEGGRSCFDGDEKQIVGDVRSARKRWALGSQIAEIDEMFAERQAQIPDPALTSYMLGLLRDPNKAAKKFGEEVMEFAQAVMTETTALSAQELADLVFGALTLARSHGQAVSLENVVNILVRRNQAKRAGSDERFNLPSKGAQDGTAA